MRLNDKTFDWDNYQGEFSSRSKESVLKIMDDYYNNTELPVSKIYEKYAIDKNIRSLAKEFPKEIVDKVCPYDGSHLEEWLPSRSGNAAYRIPECPKCGHKEENNCSCVGCMKKAEEEKKKQRELIISAYSIEVPKIKYESLSVRDKIFLSALLRSGLNEEMTKIIGKSLLENKMSSTADFDLEILNELDSKQVILVDPQSPLDAFVKENFPHSYYVYEVNYLLNIDTNVTDISAIEYPDREDIIKNRDECLQIWKEIAEAECYAYLQDQMHRKRFMFNPGPKTKLVINHLLEEYSVCQIRNLIWGSVKDAAAWYQEGNISKMHAANSVITRLNNRGEHAKAENWNLKPFHTENEFNQVSRVLFDSILQIGRNGFEKTISMDYIG